MPDVLGKARINLVAMLMDVGDYALAAEIGARLLDGADTLPQEVQHDLCHVHYNLARIHRALREFDTAYEYLDRALEAGCQVDAPPTFAVMVHQ